ncbi:MAG: acetyltransferase [Kurthia sp.]|nr:acetyltransferase [Candidatus Kurthia equi]
MPRLNKSKRRYISGLDGLRAISVLAVILYHLHIKWIDGGFLGVTVFFVLSGYLITDLLVNEYEKTGKIDFKAFWIKRFRRLLPALTVMLIVIGTWITLFQRSFLVGLRGEILAAFTYISNWYYVFQEHSYFTKFAPPSPLQHMWSLAVEEQFYIIWPILMLIALKFIPSKGKLAVLILLLSFVSTEAMAFMFTPDEDPSRVYFGTDTRAFSILLGAALAIVWPSAKLSANVTNDLKRTLNIAGVVSLLALLLMMVVIQEDGSFLYYGGMYLASAVTAVLIAVIVHPASSIGKLFSFKPLLWIGTRSYGIYIWHFPIIVLLGIAVKTETISTTKILLALALTFILSLLSWKYIEDPIRKGEWRNWLAAIRNKTWSWKWKEQTIVGRVASISITCILIIFVTGMIYQPVPEASHTNALQKHLQQEDEKNKKEQTEAQKKKAEEKALKIAQAEKIAAEKAAKKAAADKVSQERAKFKSDVANAKIILSSKEVTAIGDSVLLSASSPLTEFIPRIDIHAEVGEQVHTAIEKLKELNEDDKIADIVLIDLGSNGLFKEKQWQEIYSILGTKRQIYLMNVRVPRSWQDSVNETVKNATATHKNVHEIDWYHATSGKKELFYDDKIHPNVDGGQYFASLVAIEMAKHQK